ncbi:MAG: CAP domain-containing protein [Saprospiraceae bacterium]|nr:CAP domain-containing protein [Saprospiraceae bacterium]
MKHHYFKWVYYTLVNVLCITAIPCNSQTFPDLPTSGGLKWDDWYFANSVAFIEAQFNAGRRYEEGALNISNGVLGDLQLPSDFLNRDFKEQAIILLSAERAARNGVQSGSTTYVVTPFEGVEVTLCAISQGHADDMRDNSFFGHSGSDGLSSTERIQNGFTGCTDGTGENIAWNSFSGGFVGGIAVAIYNYIYDDALHGWGHRQLCLMMSLAKNDYDGTAAYGFVGFGRAVGSNGDFFVMDFFDPLPESSGCSYSIIDFNGGGNNGDCPENIELSGTIVSGTYQASLALSSSGMVPSTNTVELVASNSVTLNPIFEVEEGSELTIEIANCSGTNALQSGSTPIWQNDLPHFVGNKPENKID